MLVEPSDFRDHPVFPVSPENLVNREHAEHLVTTVHLGKLDLPVEEEPMEQPDHKVYKDHLAPLEKLALKVNKV